MAFKGHATGLKKMLGGGVIGGAIACTFELLARFDAANQGYANGQVLDTLAEGVNDGQLTVVEVDGTLAIVGNECAFTAQGTPVWTDLGLFSQAVAKTLGKSLAGIINLSTWEEVGISWHTAGAVVDPDNAPFAIQANATDGRLDKQGGVQIASGLALNTDYPFHLVLGGYDANGVPWDNTQAAASYLYGAALFLSIGATWTLLWREVADNTATLYAMLASLDAVGTLDDFRVPVNDYSAVLQPTVKDTFTDGNGTSLDAHTPNVIPSGGWTEQNGDWEIRGNRAENLGAWPAGAGYAATVAAGLSDAFVRSLVRVPSAAAGIILRYSDTNNFWLVRVNAASGDIEIYERNGGVWTLRGNVAAGIAINTDYEVTAIFDGTSIVGYVDGASRVAFASAFNQTETIVGIQSGNDTGFQFDNYHVHPRDGYTELDECP